MSAESQAGRYYAQKMEELNSRRAIGLSPLDQHRLVKSGLIRYPGLDEYKVDGPKKYKQRKPFQGVRKVYTNAERLAFLDACEEAKKRGITYVSTAKKLGIPFSLFGSWRKMKREGKLT